MSKISLETSLESTLYTYDKLLTKIRLMIEGGRPAEVLEYAEALGHMSASLFNLLSVRAPEEGEWKE